MGHMGTGGQPLMPGMPAGMMGGIQDQGQTVAGIAKNMSWKILFFSAALCTLAASIISVLYMVLSFSIAPCSFTTMLFMLVFGLLQVVLDLPVPHPNLTLAHIRLSIYKFFLFLTRFTGRGMWYLFLGTMIFATLYDLNISPFFGIVLGGFVGVLGLTVLIYGFNLSRRLDGVRQALIQMPQEPPPQGFTKEMFKVMAMQNAKVDFSDDELDYVFNSLSFSPTNDGLITQEEYRQWLLPGKMEIV